ncbi:hypothetical protein Ddye_031708 [Dipteronia dyeriana]|uniref:Uncharacterized protein n=1 Tax=Dipteronia dyeriana TaxID=168575 RepID=A0AAD9WMV1_9ROSI|nr:hypothetical protein Ddye_031708 [Dipteronia dyeriana]
MQSELRFSGKHPCIMELSSGHPMIKKDRRYMRLSIRFGIPLRFLQLDRKIDVRLGVCSPSARKDRNSGQSLISNASSDVCFSEIEIELKFTQSQIARLLSPGKKVK